MLYDMASGWGSLVRAESAEAISVMSALTCVAVLPASPLGLCPAYARATA